LCDEQDHNLAMRNSFKALESVIQH